MRPFIYCLLIFAYLLSPGISDAQIISTFAGNGSTGFSGDNGPAVSATFENTLGLGADAIGNIYIVDYANNRIRKVDTNGIITTIAGNGTAGFGGDNGPASAASVAFHSPTGLTVDRWNNIYVCDYGNYRIREIDTNGIIRTIAGTGVFGYSGDGGPATLAQVYNTRDVAVDTFGNIYLADMSNNRIRKIDNTGIITTIAGTGAVGFSGDGGPATAAEFSAPMGIATDTFGNIFIVDYGNYLIRKINNTGIISTFAGATSGPIVSDGAPATSGAYSIPHSVETDDSGNVYISDGSNRIYKINRAGISYRFAGIPTYGYSGDGGLATLAKFHDPEDMAFDFIGNMYIADRYNNVVRMISAVPVIHISDSFSDSICTGTNVTFSAQASGTRHPHYQWQKNSVNAGSDSIHFSTASLANGDVIKCFLSAHAGGPSIATSNTITMSVAVPASTISGADSFCIGHTSILSDNAPGGIWSSTDTAIAQVNSSGLVSGIGIGTDTIKYSVINTCGSYLETFVVYIYCPDGITAIDPTPGISVYPNPATSVLHIESLAKVKIRVMSTDGRLMIEQNNAVNIDVHSLANGMYIIKIFDQENVCLKTLKFVKRS